MSTALEREIKLHFEDADTARKAVLAIGATPLRARRLQEDTLLDSPEGMLRDRRCALRVRVESGRSLVTFKGPTQAASVKVREEIETPVSDGAVLLQILEQLGFVVWFRYEKYREEFTIDDVIIAVDETPVGTFVEIEGSDRGIAMTAEALGRSSKDYVLDSYRSLFIHYCEQRGLDPTAMLFHDD